MSQPAADRPPLFARRRDARGRLRSGPPIWDRRTWKLLFSAAGAPALVLAAVFGLALAAQTADGPAPWGISGQALAHGRWHTVAAHMVAHGNLAHLLMNLSVLLPLTPLAMVRLGSGRAGWGRFAALYAGSALAGAAMYLVLNPGGPPMVGSSGAIFGLWGAVVRIGADGGMIPLRSRRIFDEVVLFVLLNLMMVGLVFVIVRMEGGLIGSVGWEAHLGGFLFGLLAMPRLAPRTPPPAHH